MSDYGLPPMLSKRQAAEFFGVSMKAVERMLTDGTLPFTKLGKSRSSPIRISRDQMLQELGLISRGTSRRRRRVGDAEYHRVMAQMGGGS
jgi:excisionase family DNA binding protein